MKTASYKEKGSSASRCANEFIRFAGSQPPSVYSWPLRSSFWLLLMFL